MALSKFGGKFRRIALLISRRTIPLDFFSKRFPVSVKGIILTEDKEILLLKNERDEWDLPGGKVSNDFSATDCLLREIREETNLDVKIIGIKGTNIYQVFRWIRVFVIYYECKLISPKKDFEISVEHFDGKFFKIQDIEKLPMYEGYRKAIYDIISE